MKKCEVLVTKTDGKLEFIDFHDFSSVLILDDTGNVASVWVKGKLMGKIYDSDIDRVRDQKREIVFERNLSERLKGCSEGQQMIRLTNRDRDLFLTALKADVRPNRALRKAAERFNGSH